MGKDHPIAWTHEPASGGRFFYTEFGHDLRSLNTPFARQHILDHLRRTEQRGRLYPFRYRHDRHLTRHVPLEPLPDASHVLRRDRRQGEREAQALRLGRSLEEFQLEWFEEPLPAWDVEGLARVSAALDTPIASGETEYTRYGFRRMLELRSADVLMPDLQRVGGPSEFMRVGHMAESHDVPVSSHLFPETSVQVLGALANSSYLEYMPWFSELYREAIDFRDGNVEQGPAAYPQPRFETRVRAGKVEARLARGAAAGCSPTTIPRTPSAPACSARRTCGSSTRARS